ncbi:hypothetical protein EJF18_40538 [Clavispora lusitaniae]|uniref:Uncharacterized protein n=1 Tax=Clavispora lusitaniae TaxID=36911 RepID=A0ACD0WM60_CLALS|nr:hypothetical protein EJF14_40538 [Clavispora lusitaniae]QFZ34159.1 hypothetical protein EJF16_40538 [Clavispora lusitaniae]QFZ39843.1 hypothetical protein EJF15_40538 [Clavispora lusitaniae]QFZ45525.1 hypothetical protein EJF18_40538 [Clavispora lusitaniae]QFZ51189.1 hypothetical protein EJF17_40538 [Clavispora lusitaniae]
MHNQHRNPFYLLKTFIQYYRSCQMSKSTKDETKLPITDYKHLVSVYKKSGAFDKQRKLLLENFKQSQTHKNLLLKLKLMVENKIKNDPSILLKNKGKMAALIQGEIIGNAKGSSILSIVDKDIQEKIIDSAEFHDSLKAEVKDIKRKCEGISDEDYAIILAEEEKLKKEESERKEKEQAEREVAYKNNFKVKHLSAPHKIAKPPRFHFNTSHEGDGYGRDREKPYGPGRGLMY